MVYLEIDTFIFLRLLTFTHSIVSVVPFYCRFFECCEYPWMKKDSDKLDSDLSTKYCGQQAARRIILKAVAYHWGDSNPNKPLVFSFHGPPGTGKTLMSLMIRDAMFERRNKTSYFHFISASTSFPHLDSRKHLSDYKTDLRTKIKEAVYGCQHAVIVIDDVHLLQTELLDSMAPFLDSHENVDGVSYRRAIFIFISNTGMFGLIDLADEYYRKGKTAHEIKYLDAEKIITAISFTEKESAFYQSQLISRNLIDYFVPFFPMDENEVKCCIKRELSRRGMFQPHMMEERALMDRVLQNIHFLYEADPWFSEFGCKSVKKAISLVDW